MRNGTGSEAYEKSPEMMSITVSKTPPAALPTTSVAAPTAWPAAIPP